MSEQEYLKYHWTKLWDEIGISNPLLVSFYEEILEAYQQANRYYHNLQHLYYMLQLLDPYQTNLEHPQAVSLAIFYHDVVYQALRKDNELKSAKLAVTHLEALEVEQVQIQLVYDLILATQKHEATIKSSDFYYLLDADLAILGATEQIYDQYAQNVRWEYRFIPSMIYNRGRKKVLEHFLDKSRIYLTVDFRERFEKKARKNLFRELGKY